MRPDRVSGPGATHDRSMSAMVAGRRRAGRGLV